MRSRVVSIYTVCEYRDDHTCLIVVVDNKMMANPCDRAMLARIHQDIFRYRLLNITRTPPAQPFPPLHLNLIHPKPRIEQTNLTECPTATISHL